MPFLDLQSNLPASSFSEDFLKKLVSVTAAALGKPEDVSQIKGFYLCKLLSNFVQVSMCPRPNSVCSKYYVTNIIVQFLNLFIFLFYFHHFIYFCRIGIMFNALQPHQVGKKGTVMSFL
uniref:Uncharacterized protein n=1 Tax=Periophthalmus magnuspinnatus TaxID=409849 RepID=A0A3B3ZMP8_9GOBI